MGYANDDAYLEVANRLDVSVVFFNVDGSFNLRGCSRYRNEDTDFIKNITGMDLFNYPTEGTMTTYDVLTSAEYQLCKSQTREIEQLHEQMASERDRYAEDIDRLRQDLAQQLAGHQFYFNVVLLFTVLAALYGFYRVYKARNQWLPVITVWTSLMLNPMESQFNEITSYVRAQCSLWRRVGNRIMEFFADLSLDEFREENIAVCQAINVFQKDLKEIVVSEKSDWSLLIEQLSTVTNLSLIPEAVTMDAVTQIVTYSATKITNSALTHVSKVDCVQAKELIESTDLTATSVDPLVNEVIVVDHVTEKTQHPDDHSLTQNCNPDEMDSDRVVTVSEVSDNDNVTCHTDNVTSEKNTDSVCSLNQEDVDADNVVVPDDETLATFFDHPSDVEISRNTTQDDVFSTTTTHTLIVNESGNVVSVTHYNSADGVTCVTHYDIAGVIDYVTHYNEMDVVTCTTYFNNAGDVDSVTYYNNVGGVDKKTDYNHSGHIAYVTYYNADGDIDFVTHFKGDGEIDYVTYYNHAGWVDNVVYYKNSGGILQENAVLKGNNDLLFTTPIDDVDLVDNMVVEENIKHDDADVITRPVFFEDHPKDFVPSDDVNVYLDSSVFQRSIDNTTDCEPAASSQSSTVQEVVRPSSAASSETSETSVDSETSQWSIVSDKDLE